MTSLEFALSHNNIIRNQQESYNSTLGVLSRTTQTSEFWVKISDDQILNLLRLRERLDIISSEALVTPSRKAVP